MTHGAGTTRRALCVAGLAAFGCGVSACAPAPPARPAPPDYAGLAGWTGADHEKALAVFLGTARIARGADALGVSRDDWRAVAALIEDDLAAGADARAAIERRLRPQRTGVSGGDARFTAYYEPELAGARTRFGPYQHPIHARPPELGARAYHSRADIMAGALDGRGLELFWLADPVAAFFLQIQGSGRIRLAEGGLARVGFAGKNNRRYVAIGRLLVERGEMTVETATADAIKAWLRRDPARGAALMDQNPSYVFFEEKPELGSEDGPIGALGAPLTAGVSIAVDPAHHPLGAMIWAEATGVEGYEGRLMVAQDVGGAIKGPQRADLFIGVGDAAGSFAGDVRAGGRLITLLPRPVAGA